MRFPQLLLALSFSALLDRGAATQDSDQCQTCIGLWENIYPDYSTRTCKKRCKRQQDKGNFVLDPVCERGACCDTLCATGSAPEACLLTGYCSAIEPPTDPPTDEPSTLEPTTYEPSTLEPTTQPSTLEPTTPTPDSALDLYQPRRFDIDNVDKDYAYAGKCVLSGCTRPPNRVCSGPLIGRGSFRVDDIDEDGDSEYIKGVENCAKKCRDKGLEDDGTSACESFNYVYNRTETSSNCYLYKRFPNKVIGNRPGSTRVDYTNHYCYTSKLWRCVSDCDTCPPGTGPRCPAECQDPCFSCTCRGPGSASEDPANCPALSC